MLASPVSCHRFHRNRRLTQESGGDGMRGGEMAARLIIVVFVAMLILISTCSPDVESELTEEANISLVDAAMRGQSDQVRALLKEGADVNETDQVGNSALSAAASGGHTSTVQALLNAGVDVNAKLLGQGLTALMSAAGGGHSEVVIALLDAGADVNAKNQRGWSPLMSATFAGHTEIVELLKAAGAKE